MNELIKVTQNKSGEQLVSAKELYEFLGYDRSQWSRWSNKNIIQDDFFIENEDYTKLDIMSNGNKTTDYVLKLDMAKELSMLARNEKGKQARKYFIECEKKLKILNPLTMLLNMDKEQLALTTLELTKQIQENKPKVEYYDNVLTSNETFTTTQVAKIFGMSARGLNKQLELEGIQFKQRGTWLLKSKYQNKGYHKIKTITYGENKSKKQLEWTEKGIEFISKIIERL